MARSLSLPTPTLTRIELREILLQALGSQTEDIVEKILALLLRDERKFTARLDALEAALARIEQLLSEPVPVSPPTALKYSLIQGPNPMITNDVTLVAGAAPGDPGGLDQINVVDQNGVILAPATISWSAFSGVAAQSDLVMAMSADGNGFNFTANAAAPTEVGSAVATWKDPTGVAADVAAMALNFHITGVGPVAPTSLQYDEVVGA